MKLAPSWPIWPYVLLLAAQLPYTSSRALLPRSRPQESSAGGAFDAEFAAILDANSGIQLEPVGTQQEPPADNELACTQETQDASTQPEPSGPFQISTDGEGELTYETFLLNGNWNKGYPFTHAIQMGLTQYEGVIALSTSGAWIVLWGLEVADRVIKEGKQEIDQLFDNGNGKYKYRPVFTVSQAYKESVHPVVAKGFKPFLETLRDRNDQKAQTDDPFELLGIIAVRSSLAPRSGIEGKYLDLVTTALKREMTRTAKYMGLLATSSEKPNTKPLRYGATEGGRDISIVLEKESRQTKLIVKVGDYQREFVK